MKRILIAGKDSYIGMSVEKWLMRPEYAGMYQVDTADMRDDKWRGINFSGYDAVFHVAGIVHQREKRKNIKQYYEINVKLASETAKRAKSEGVKQFILLSSMNVYGMREGVIDSNTLPEPGSHYGKSKLAADRTIMKMADRSFCVSILRPPMVYGKGCKGNYQLLRKAALMSPFFPYIKNRRSMIHIDNLAEYVRRMIGNEVSGIFLPQNMEYVETGEMVRQIAQLNGKSIKFIQVLNPLILLLCRYSDTVNKVFGSLIYRREENEWKPPVCFSDSMKRTEAG